MDGAHRWPQMDGGEWVQDGSMCNPTCMDPIQLFFHGSLFQSLVNEIAQFSFDVGAICKETSAKDGTGRILHYLLL